MCGGERERETEGERWKSFEGVWMGWRVAFGRKGEGEE